MLDPMTQEEIRTIVREEIAMDEMRQLQEGSTSPLLPSCDRCIRPRAVPGAIASAPGTLHFGMERDA